MPNTETIIVAARPDQGSVEGMGKSPYYPYYVRDNNPLCNFLGNTHVHTREGAKTARNSMENQEKMICWWSGGITSAVACKMAIDKFGDDRCLVVFIDTKNEDEDTYRFMRDCAEWYGVEEIQTISNSKYPSIQAVWERYASLNVANGAICSAVLKREMRVEFQKRQPYFGQVFGFDSSEGRRAKSLLLNYPESKPVFPLVDGAVSKEECVKILAEASIEIPRAYHLGFRNNNCLGTGCVQGGIGYWQKMRDVFPQKFEAMAAMEHRLTDMKGKPVTCLKDQSKAKGNLFLLPHPGYPDVAHIGMKPRREVKPVMECNGMCGTFDLQRESANDDTYEEIFLESNDAGQQLALSISNTRAEIRLLYQDVFGKHKDSNPGWHLIDALMAGTSMPKEEADAVHIIVEKNRQVTTWMRQMMEFGHLYSNEIPVVERFIRHATQLDELATNRVIPSSPEYFPEEIDRVIKKIIER